MKGLLIKDFQLLKKQKQLIVLAVFIAFAFLVSQTANIMFAVSYMTIMFSFASTTTIIYDQHNSGMSFLLTLPVSRSDYAKEKYILMLFSTAASLTVILVLILIGSCTGRIPFDPDSLGEAILASALWSMISHALMIPIQLKFGAEKSRMALLLILGIVYAIFFGWIALTRHFHIDTAALLQSLVARTGTAALTLLLCAAVTGILGISFVSSIHIMKKKEY